MQLIAVAALITIIVVLVISPTSLTFLEHFEDRQEVTHRVKTVMPKAVVDDAYVLKSSLVPCVCPASSCPSHQPDDYGLKSGERPKIPQEHIQAAQARQTKALASASPEPIYLDYNSMLK